MNKKISSLLLLLVLTITDAYLLSHPNLIGKLGVLLYKHTYIKNFPTALLTVTLVVGLSLFICEILKRFSSANVQKILFSLFLVVSVIWLAYVYNTFSSFSYRMTGKAFIYGAHLLPVMMIGIYGRYLLKSLLSQSTNKDVNDFTAR